ncbi:MAG: class I SAM-dependent methyltransferase, partial [Planctomycetaceae bacterium]|nr:class I SAM-dependent methyltransferase [Planctomycetaceae bacterium]
DLCEPLLEVAQKRANERNWPQVIPTHADATTFTPEEGSADVVTFSYSLTMIPDWFAAVENALRILKPGGVIAVVDFFVARKYPAESLVRHGWTTRSIWPLWFASDNVFLNPDHIPFLTSHFETLRLEQRRGKVPFLPLVRAPYYIFLGKKR